MRNLIVVVILLLLVGLGYLILNTKSNSGTPAVTNTKIQEQTAEKQSGTRFANPKKSAHYESNTPAHGSTFAGVPINVIIDFNFDLAKPSEIKILKDGEDYGIGETLIDSSSLAMRRYVNSDAPDGLYTVEYNACWPDTSCHDGSFQFVIDRSKAMEMEDQTGKNEIVIKLSQIRFNPQNIKVSKGTKVTWVNDESMGHYVNTDSHPGHTYYPEQNSELLEKGDAFSLVFNTPGFYPYHCSAHADSMVGSLLVE